MYDCEWNVLTTIRQAAWDLVHTFTSPSRWILTTLVMPWHFKLHTASLPVACRCTSTLLSCGHEGGSSNSGRDIWLTLQSTVDGNRKKTTSNSGKPNFTDTNTHDITAVWRHTQWSFCLYITFYFMECLCCETCRDNNFVAAILISIQLIYTYLYWACI